MATLTIRGIPDELVERIRAVAAQNGTSMEQEVRDLLQERFAKRSAILERLRGPGRQVPTASAKEIREWVDDARRR